MPQHVGTKTQSKRAYPVGGEYVLDVDSYIRYAPHGHRTEPEGFCYGCLGNVKELTERACDVLAENYSDIRVVFSGQRGFHVHVLDFELRDWTRYDEKNPLRSHEVARFVYTKHLQKRIPDLFDEPHFKLSCDTMRVMSVPDSLNGRSGLTCSYLGGPSDFSMLSVEEIIRKARGKFHITTGNAWTIASDWKNPRFNLINAHHEPIRDGR
jgi:hypothetical protein